MKEKWKMLQEAAEKAAEKIRMAWKTLNPGEQKIFLLGTAVMTLAALFLCSTWYVYALQRPEGGGTVHFEIKKEMTGDEIAGLLRQKKVITSPLAFRAALAFTGDGRSLKSGHYRLPEGMTVKDALAALEKGQNDFRTVMIPEGSDAAQIAAILTKAGIPAGKKFLATASSYAPMPYMYGPESAEIKGEGFLFPDTYDIPVDYTARQICDLMYRRMDDILTQDIRNKAQAKGLSVHELVTLASLVEKEAKWPEDRVLIASVIMRRLQEGMPLQIDATVQYILGEPKAELTQADTQIPSPYNTYTRTGLPPGPIASPGRDSLAAVLTAEAGPYLYYVADQNGHHVFSRTYEEHQAHIHEIYGQTE